MDGVTEITTLADAVMPDNKVQSITQTIENQNTEQEAQVQQPAQPLMAPAAYQFHVPEGYFLSDGMREELTKTAQQYGMTNDAANAMIQLHLKQMEATAREMEAKASEQPAIYEREARQDPEFGGAKFEQSLSTAKAALANFGSAKLLELLDQTGLGNHPEMIRLLYRVGRAQKEGGYGGGAPVPTETRTRADIMYGG